MATLAENLLSLNEAKQAIKTAIESKGQDLTDIPFTQYADKIAAIAGGGRKVATGTVTFATDITQQTITHNLGVRPSIFLLYPLIPQSEMVQNRTYGWRYWDMTMYGVLGDIGVKALSQTTEYSSVNGTIGHQTCQARAGMTDETIAITGYRSAAYLIPAGIEFGWIAIE